MKTRHFAAIAIAAASFLPYAAAQAASDEECAIWICLPAGFPGGAGCDGPYDAMVDRIKDFKSPLPNYGSCVTDMAASLDPVYQLRSNYGGGAWISGEFHRGKRCRITANNEWNYTGCNRGSNQMYVEVFNGNGEQMGDTVYVP